MKLIKLIMLMACVAVSVQAQEQSDATAPVPVSNIEILQLAESVKLAQWADVAKRVNFGSTSKKSRHVSEGDSVDLVENWKVIYPSEKAAGSPARNITKAWSPERATAQALLQRPCNSSQKKWLESFLATADALAAKDAKKFKELVLPLADDARTLL